MFPSDASDDLERQALRLRLDIFIIDPCSILDGAKKKKMKTGIQSDFKLQQEQGTWKNSL